MSTRRWANDGARERVRDKHQPTKSNAELPPGSKLLPEFSLRDKHQSDAELLLRSKLLPDHTLRASQPQLYGKS